ncbi:helix-turn-helix domain-containing protein [Devosia sp. Root105]|uniref:helix-turn-helix domain-containing protein n=1 Tax=Devosia sp. Root105 TaxID=1736423 RepID=UPI0006F9B925|nr:helix-turn-helix domain-containing protein [Devosia sp. Root105]KQU95255.1 hypothetical protein ASC68_19075 [Devosia sp. Root105]
MMLYRQLRLAPVRAADASPSQQRLAEERRAREARIRRAAQHPLPASNLTVRPFHAPRPRPMQPLLLPAAEAWPDYREPAPYDTMEFSARYLVAAPSARPLTAREIIDEVVAKHRVSRVELSGSSRRAPVTAARREASWRIRHEVLVNGRQISLPEIARHLGGRDHTTVLYNIRRYAAELEARALSGDTARPAQQAGAR